MNNSFINFSDINLSEDGSWQNKRILSLDQDWAIDEVMEYAVDIICKYGIKANIFITNNSDYLSKLKSLENIELGIHPNFNPLINKEGNARTAKQTIEELMQIVPSAKCIRSHSMTHSGRWLDLYQQFGLTHSSQYFMNGMPTIQPFNHLNGLVEAPVYFADDGWLYNKSYARTTKYNFEGCGNTLKVLNFHPIHIALNSPSLAFYNRTREKHKIWKDVITSKNMVQQGVEDLLLSIVSQ